MPMGLEIGPHLIFQFAVCPLQLGDHRTGPHLIFWVTVCPLEPGGLGTTPHLIFQSPLGPSSWEASELSST